MQCAVRDALTAFIAATAYSEQAGRGWVSGWESFLGRAFTMTSGDLLYGCVHGQRLAYLQNGNGIAG